MSVEMHCPVCYGFVCNCSYLAGCCPSSNQPRIPVIIWFDAKALLEKFPGLKGEGVRNHPYRQQLRAQYKEWINQIKEHVSHLRVSHIFDLLITGIATTLPPDKISQLTHLPFVKGIDLDRGIKKDKSHIYPPGILPKMGLNQHNLAMMGIPQVRVMRDMTGHPLDGMGVKVAVLDHGFILSLLRFGPEGTVADQFNFVQNNTDVFTPGEQHGNQMAQMILDVAPNIQMLAYKIFGISSMIAALEHAIAEQAQVINLSITVESESFILNKVVTTATDQGVIVVKSAGNEGEDDWVNSPGDDPDVLTVGATNEKGDKVAIFSNYSASIFKPDIVAPGSYQLGSVIASGTSGATAYASGAVALLTQKHPHWRPKQVIFALSSTAIPIQERDPEAFGSQGGGRIYVPKALRIEEFPPYEVFR